MIFDEVCHDRGFAPAPRELGTVGTLRLVEVCPVDGAQLDDRRDCPACPPALAGVARRVNDLRRALESPVRVVYTGHGLGHQWTRPDIRLLPSRVPTPGPQPVVEPGRGHRVPRKGRAL